MKRAAVGDPELKWTGLSLGVDTSSDVTWISYNTFASEAFDSTAQGDGDTQRDGRSIRVKSFQLRGYFQSNTLESQATPVGDVMCRILLVRDHRNTGAFANISDVMVTTANPMESYPNLQNADRFEILMDERSVIRVPSMNEGALNLFASGDGFVPFDYYEEREYTCHYSDAAKDISSHTNVATYLFFAFRGLQGTNQGRFSCTSRIRFLK